MEEYVRRAARLFDGIRLDNCHSTPRHVARELLSCARDERPGLFVIAELFTGSEKVDAMWCADLGLDALIREALNPQDARQLSHLCHLHGVHRAIGQLGDVDFCENSYENDESM